MLKFYGVSCVSPALFVFFGILVSGCSTVPQSVKDPVVGECGAVGLRTKVLDNKLIITRVIPNSSAEKSRLQPGDALLECNGKKMDSLPNRLAFFREVKTSPGKVLNLVIDRHGEVVSAKTTVEKVSVRSGDRLLFKLDDELVGSPKVALAVIVDQVSYVGYPTVDATEVASAKITVGTFYENMFLSVFGDRENFVLVDRNKSQALLEELRFQESGVVANELVRNIGNITGATHILFVNWSRYNNGKDITQARLINVESGAVLATDTLLASNTQKIQ